MGESGTQGTEDWLQAQWQRQRLFDAAGIGSWVRSADGSRVIWSPGLKTLFGIPPDVDPSYDQFLACIDARDIERVAEAIRSARKSGEVFTTEYRVNRSDIPECWVEATAQWIYGDGGELLYVQGIAKDITARKHNEQQQLQNERRLQALVDSSADVVFRMNADFTTLEGISAKGVLAEVGRPTQEWLQLYVPDLDQGLVMTTIAAALREVKRFDLEHRIIRRDGTIGWGHSRVMPIILPDGRVTEWAGMLTDITESKRLQIELEGHRSHLEELVASRTSSLVDALRANEQLASRLSMACRAARIGTWYASFQDRVTIWDDRMYELFCMERDGGEASPSHITWYRRIRVEDRPKVRLCIGVTERNEDTVDVVCQLDLPGGEQRFLRCTSLIERTAAGSPLRIVGTCEDVTGQQRDSLALLEAKANAEASNLAKSKFVAAASHDLRQPLAATNLYLDILKDAAPRGLAATVVHRIRMSVDSLTAMLDSLLDVARLDTNALQLRVSLFPVHQLERWLLEEFAEQFLMKGLRLLVRFPRKAWLLRTDETFIKGILRNLLVNALKYTDAGGLIVALRAQGARFRFQVWDTGIGIDQKHIPKLFDEFFQVGNAERDGTKGMGLGLSIVRREAQLIGGLMACKSKLGKGSVFELSLPREHFIESPGKAEGEDRESGRLISSRLLHRRVCLIEDVPAVRDALSLLLASWGLHVTAFSDSESALGSLELRLADFVITDFRLPGELNGIELLQELERREIRPLRGIVLTGELDIPTSPDPAGWPWPILRKPCDTRLLWSTLVG